MKKGLQHLVIINPIGRQSAAATTIDAGFEHLVRLHFSLIRFGNLKMKLTNSLTIELPTCDYHLSLQLE